MPEDRKRNYAAFVGLGRSFSAAVLGSGVSFVGVGAWHHDWTVIVGGGIMVAFGFAYYGVWFERGARNGIL